jgi:hypothetical protein
MYYPPTQPISDHGPGLTITYFTKGQSDNELRELLIHENGHGYGKLGDEYFYAGNHPNQADINRHTAMVPYGWSKNTDITGDPALVKWAKFLTDPRYEGQGLGVFLGGETFASGFWRPTNNSIMRYNPGGYNAPSREAIYYRTHKLVYGLDWEYDFEEFVAWDMAHPYLAPEMRGIASRDPGMIVMPHTPPVIIALSADEAFRMGK